jgi:lysozyme family protein
MRDNFEWALAEVLRHEGGWSDHPADPGGATMNGITLATYQAHLGRSATKEELRDLKPDVRAEIYRKNFWDKVRGDDLPSGVDFAVFDFAVNSGPGRAARYIQAIVAVETDGQLGPKSLAAIRNYCDRWGANDLILRYCASRLDFMRKLGTWKVFGKGWSRRVSGVQKMAQAKTLNVVV